MLESIFWFYFVQAFFVCAFGVFGGGSISHVPISFIFKIQKNVFDVPQNASLKISVQSNYATWHNYVTFTSVRKVRRFFALLVKPFIKPILTFLMVIFHLVSFMYNNNYLQNSFKNLAND